MCRMAMTACWALTRAVEASSAAAERLSGLALVGVMRGVKAGQATGGGG